MGAEPHELCVILSELNFGGQQSLVTPNSFDKPNIVLVCKILEWFANILKLSSHSSKPNGGETIQSAAPIYPSNSTRPTDYVEFLCHIGRSCFQLIGVKLDLVALCRADRSCCPELLKIGRVVFEAARLSLDATKPSSEEPFELELAKSQNSCNELLAQISQENSFQKLSLECCQLSEELQALLRDEESRHQERLKLIDRRLELDDIKRVLGDSLDGVKRETEQMRRCNAELERDISILDEKLAAKEAEIGSTRQKLSDLLNKSPAYASQYETLMKEYERAYERYVSAYRNYAYLRSCMGVYSTDSRPALERDWSMCLGADGEKSYRDWLREHGTGVRWSRWWDFVNERRASPSAQLEGLSKKSSEAAALLVFDNGPVASTLAEGRDTVGPARLLESLLLVSGMSKPRSESLLGTPAECADGAGVELVAGETTAGGAAGRVRVAGDDGENRRLADVGLELEGLLDEFAPVKLVVGVPDGLDGASGEPSEEEEEEAEDDDDDEDEDEEEESDDEGDSEDEAGGEGLRARG